MRIGIVCPYALDVPGGVQAHVLGLAQVLRDAGEQVSVLGPVEGMGEAVSNGAAGSPAASGTSAADALPPWVERAGGTVAVPYNGAVARVAFGPLVAMRVRRWIDAGRFDVLHLHEPITPSVSLLALWAADGPLVATFHTASLRSRALLAAGPLVLPSLDKVSARIAVSEQARDRLASHLGIDAVVLPNGVQVQRFAAATPNPAWQGRPGAPTIAFVGRLTEPRKGFAVLAAALAHLRSTHPGLRVLVAGPGDPELARALAGRHADALDLVGILTEDAKASLLSSVDAYVAPQIGGESFGVVIAEAMSAGAPVVASALPAFADLLDGGRLGLLADVGDPSSLAESVLAVLDDPAAAADRAQAAATAVRRYDWSVVGHEVMSVYEAVVGDGAPGQGRGAGQLGSDPAGRRLLAQWRGETT